MSSLTTPRWPAVLALSSVLLIALNFGLDLLRRFDFQNTRDRVEKETEAALLDAEDLLNLAFTSLEETRRNDNLVASRITEVEEIVSLLLDRTDRLSQLTVKERPVAAQPPLPIVQRESDTYGAPRLIQILEAPLVELEARLQELTSDPSRREHFLKHSRPQEWDVSAIIDDYEARYAVSLSESERRLLELRIEAFRTASQLTFNKYRLRLKASTAQRLQSGDYDTALEDGTYSAPEYQRGDLLAVSLIGQYKLVWEKESYPELHRLELVRKYLPAAMLENMNDWFTTQVTRRRAR